MDEELKNYKCAYKTDWIIQGIVPLEDILVCFFNFLVRCILDYGHKLINELQSF